MQANRSVYIETYGCQMNMADTEIVLSIMLEAGFNRTEILSKADVVLVNTCAVRENAEQRIIGRLGDFNHYKKTNPNVIVGVLGCMAERVRKELMEMGDFVDLVIGPDLAQKLDFLASQGTPAPRGAAHATEHSGGYPDTRRSAQTDRCRVPGHHGRVHQS